MSATLTNPSDDARPPRKPGAQEPPRDLARDVQAGQIYFPCADHAGSQLAVGLKVLVPCVVTQAHSFGHVNLTLETEHPLRPGLATTTLALSSHQVVRADSVESPPCAVCRPARIDEVSNNRVIPDRRLLFGVFYREVLNPDDAPLATFSERADAVDWVEGQRRDHDLDPASVEIVALKLLVPLFVQAG